MELKMEAEYKLLKSYCKGEFNQIDNDYQIREKQTLKTDLIFQFEM